MNTQLIEFLNTKDVLRGILTLPSKKPKKFAICVHGFERCATTEKKFKKITDELGKKHIATLRIDFSGTGLSDGNFKFTTIKKQSKNLVRIVETIKRKFRNPNINIVTHSLGASILANEIKNLENKINKIVLISPALNQKDLLRYWFTKNQIKKEKSNIEITWHNYTKYFNEKSFQKDCMRKNRMTKSNYINPEYFLTGKEVDFSDKIKNLKTYFMFMERRTLRFQ